MAKRIAIYTSSYPPKSGGIASAHYNLSSRLQQRHDVRVFTYRDAERAAFPHVVHGRPWPGMKALFRVVLRKLLRQPLISRNLSHCDAVADAAAAVVSCNRALQRFRPDIIICPDHYLPSLLLKKPPKSRLIWMARNNYLRFTEQPLVPPANVIDLLLAHRLERRAVLKADAVISPSGYMLSVFKRTLERELPMRVAANFVDQQRVESVQPSDLRSQLQLPSEAPLVYLPSAGVPMKGARYLYEIVRALGSQGVGGVYVSGTISGDLRHELLSLAPNVRCFLPGHVAYADNLKHVAACDFTVSPTLIENLSNALVESILLGVPVVTFDTGGNREIVQPGRTGVVVGHADIDALICETRDLAKSPTRRSELKFACRLSANEVINTNRIDAVYEEVFEMLCN